MILITFLLGISIAFWGIQRLGLLRKLRPGERWAISTLRGKSLSDLSSQLDRAVPSLTAKDIRDIPALFVADPFMVYESSRWHLFFEVMNAKSGRGEIGLATSEDAKQWKYEKIILKEAFHLSFPHIFSHENRYYMIPETFEAEEIRLYEAVKFPEEWKYVQPLVSGKDFVDAVIFYDQSRFWLWTSTVDNKNLYLYSSQTLLGPWKEHPQSPVIQNDAASARLAGRITWMDGKRIRLAQVDEPSYGLKVRAFEITELNPERYAEKECSFSPILQGSGKGWNAKGMHHLDLHQFNQEWIASVDGYRDDASWERDWFWIQMMRKDFSVRLKKRISSCAALKRFLKL